MNAFTGVPAVLLVSALGGIAVGISGRGTGPVWALVVCATVLPAIAALNAARKARRVGGREGMAWRILALSMALMVPVYATEFIEAYVLETGFIAGAYLFGALAVLFVPLPNAGPYQRMVASLDALGIGIVVATGTFWIVSASGLDIQGHVMWAVSDAAIMAMIAYVAVRRSQRSGIDWSLVWLLGAVGAYLGGLLISTVSPTAYFLGHSADYAYFLGMALFAVAPVAIERREERSRHILRPVRWGHVLGPYLLVAVLAAALVVHQITVWGDDPTGTVIELGILATMLLVLVRQLALIAEQRRKIETEQSGVIATISHELRTPLTAVVGFLDLLEDWHQFSEEDKIEMVTLMRDQSHVLARVIGDLVDVARERIGHLDLAWTDIAVDEFFATAIALVPELNETTLHLDVADEVGLTADRERMLQIITNYLSNAAQYGSGHVEISVFVEAGETVIEVHDDGPGVPDIFRLVVWERFERGPQRQGAIPGSGIGLSVARGIARSHGGETYYRRSDRLGGACFSVRIPLQRFPSQRSVSASPVVTA